MCNNKAILPNIPCLKECRIVGKIVRQVLNANETICFMVDTQEITYTMDMFHATLKLLGLEEEYHTIKDDTLLVNVYTTREVTIRGMLIPNDLLTDAIKETQVYKDYEAKATRTPNPDVVQKRKRKGKQATGESSSPRLSLKIRIRQQKSTSTTPLPPSDDQERDDIIEATQLGLVLDKTTKVYEEQHNVAIVKEKLLDEDVEKLVEGNDESDGNDFADTVLLSDEYSVDRLEPGSQKENLENNDEDDDDDDDEKKDEKHDDANDDDDDNDDRDNHALIKTQRTGSSEIRSEKMQTPIPSPLRSLKTDLSLDKEIDKELMVSVSPTPDATTQDQSKPISRRYTHIYGAVKRIILEKVNESLKEIVPNITTSATNDLIKDNLPRLVTDVVKNERESSQRDVSTHILQEFAAHAPQIIEELFRS
ncbi:hypothetical protein Tco_1089927 [Tanacetum coccineum]|uniref:Uncharacterized protein n=1 Tax=Tanacetum coccineum TaxID=301880 RepID=A0ABQ5I403_9ASTR